MPLHLRICRDALAMLSFIYVLRIFLPFDVSILTFALGIIIMITAYSRLNKVFRQAVAIFIGLALFLLISESMAFAVWMDGVHSLISIVAILVVMRLFTIPIDLGNYKDALEIILLTRLRTERKIFAFLGILTHVLASFLLNGAIPLVHSLFGELIKDNIKENKRFEGAAIICSYSLIVLWAPSSVTILIAMEATGAAWGQLAVPGIILAILGLALSNVVETHWLSGTTLDLKTESDHTMTERQAYGKALHILIVVVAMLSSNMLLERICFATSVERVLLTGVIIAGIWIFMYRKHAGLRQELWKYKESGVLIAGDMAGLFIAVGLFAESFAVSHWMEHIARGLTWFFDFLGVFAPCLIPMIIVLFSMIGMHPFISIILVGGMAASISGMVTPAVLGVALINGCVLSFLLSPFMGITLILSSLIQCSPMDISFKSNRQFFIAYYMLSFVYLLLLQKWI